MNHEITRKQAAESINRAMNRFPLLLEILGKLAKSEIPSPGDDELRRGCERACTSILAELTKIPTAREGKASKAEEVARGWLSSESASQLIDPSQLERMDQFIVRILGDGNA